MESKINIDKYLKLLEKESTSRIFAIIADNLLKMGKTKEALDICLKGLEKDPGYYHARLVLAKVYIALKQQNRAKGELLKILESAPDNCNVLYLLGEIYQAENNEKGVEDIINKLTLLNPKDSVIIRFLTAIKQKRGWKFSDINKLELFSDEVKTDKEREIIFTETLGALYLKQGHVDKAKEVFKNILDRNPNNFSIREKLKTIETKTTETLKDTVMPNNDIVVKISLLKELLQELKEDKK